ncbi:Glutamate receptor ionotropic, kainate 2 [Portunus trituberculatus]|uniref:Glutamate receptor ionotropic, kainate 2 n=1 Tax=Portunus trituberculatus TaxID=210409 RepID=A0A5B7GL39_PORTR|nr:Glutamate receptor ionotropic, kainate 2 [Portunus trituberculatus]
MEKKSSIAHIKEPFLRRLLQEKPYVMVHPSKNITGNARFYGFCIDLLDHVAGMVGFNYEVELEFDGRYGNYNQTTGEWDGMVRHVMAKVLMPRP